MNKTLTLILLFAQFFVGAQSTVFPLNSRAYSILEELDIRTNDLFTTVKPISRKITSSLHSQYNRLTSISDQRYLSIETATETDTIILNEKPFWMFFTKPDQFWSYNEPGLDLSVNPVVVLGLGREEGSGDWLFENYRGLEIMGKLDDKVSFYTMLTENQARLPGYVRQVTDTTLAVPYEGFWKQYKNTGIDFLRAQAYIDFQATKHIAIQFGYGKHFIGDGQRSLILSDFGNNYPYLRLQTNYKKFQYTNLYAQLTGQIQGGSFGLLGTGSFTKKYLAMHHLSFKATQNLTIGLFESVIFGDSTESQYKLSYLNPIIFYRALEQQDGSSDNVMLGLDFKWNLFNSLSLYGQLVVDELVIKEVVNRTGWWGNKQGVQLGVKYFNPLGLKNGLLQVEYNVVRPYVYAHASNYTSYSHYNSALAHPLGANFREVLFHFDYRFLPKWEVKTTTMVASSGRDQGALTYGRDILKPYLAINRPSDFDNQLLQGVREDILMMQMGVSYEVLHNLTIDTDVIIRNSSQQGQTQNDRIFNLGLHWNFPVRSYLF